MIEVKLHDIGEGMTQADILTFLVKQGDIVKADDPLVEVQTDKMTAEIPAPMEGIVKEFTVKIGDTVPVGTTLLKIEPLNSKLLQKPSVKMGKKTENAFQTSSSINTKSKRVMAAPFTRKIARDNGINIEDIQGTGPAGRITEEDVLQFIQNKSEQTTLLVNRSERENRRNDSLAEFPTSYSVSYSGRRKQIGTKMAHSLYSIPHCTHYEEIDVSNILQVKADWKMVNKNISATAFFLKAVSLSLKDFPIFNATLNEKEESIHIYNEHHIGVATDTKQGLIVPVIRNVEKKSLLQIHEELKYLTVRAQENKLSVKEMTGSTFTISNVGPLGGSIGATPIINPPEVGLLAFHKTKKRPVVDKNDQIVVRSMMNVSMSFDHRVADGATAVAFTNRLVQLIENPNLFMLELV
ncbi:dihydrolipoamide acetyltransferase family protein [Sutcliffiella cohnii]|uniref:dihydrolipoamide acetyltransferase family protein n=1 Tax=Sutcliffiella cohnii TaxID=33932 RepID=UPI00399D593E